MAYGSAMLVRYPQISSCSSRHQAIQWLRVIVMVWKSTVYDSKQMLFMSVVLYGRCMPVLYFLVQRQQCNVPS